jgi:hypothetical protein
MTWLFFLLVAMLVAAVAAVTGIKPTGTRPVAHTQLMGAARWVLFVAVAVLAYLAFHSRGGV